MQAPEDDTSLSVNTEDAIDVVARFDFIVASLEKAGVPPEELHRFKQVVSRLPLAKAAAIDAIPDDGVGHQQEIVAEGALEKLQRGTQGFAPVWKSRWIRILPGELQVFESAGRPEKPDTPCLFCLPLSLQQTRIDPGNAALCKRLGREAILMVGSTTAVGGTLRCVTLATKDTLALQKWTSFLEKAMSQEGRVSGASIFRASQTGDILRVKELISRGVSVNRANPYGCVPLHYAVKHAAECAAMVARGGDGAGADQSKVRAQEALRVVVFLMSHGADARAVNRLGETPLELGSRLTSGFPKSRSLLMSILDSSKYQVTGGTIFIVPAAGSEAKKRSPPQNFLESVREEGVAEREDDETTATGDLHVLKTTTARGVTFSPSRRNRRAKKRYELARSKLPYVSSSASPSFGEGRCRSSTAGTPALPRGDHETMLGGARHRLAAGHGARCSRNDLGKEEENCRGRRVRTSHGSGGGGGGGGGGDVEVRNRRQKGATVGVAFKNYRMGRSSGVLVGGGFKRRRPTCLAGRPSSCPVRTGGVVSPTGDIRRHRRPATTNRGDGMERRSDNSSVVLRGGGGGGGRGGGAGTRAMSSRQQQRTRDGRHPPKGGGQNKRSSARQRRGKEEEEDERGPSVPDSEARRQISEWLRESAGTASAVPPATAHGAGEYLVETSSYVAAGRRSDVYKALQAIKGDGRGELISAEKLRTTLCRVGQPLLPNEMDELLQETDPTGTGYVSCSRLSKLVARERLASLAPGTTYNEEDDVVLQAKARRLARAERLERTAAIAQQQQQQQAAADER